METKPLIFFGASGHAKVLVEIAEAINRKILFLIDDNRNIQKLLDYDVVRELEESKMNEAEVVISIGNNVVRKSVSERINAKYATLIHPSAIVSPRAKIGKGTVVMAGVTINCGAVIGNHCIINTNASIDHDCIIGDYVHISPNVGMAGDVSVGEGAHIGIGTNIIQGIKIGTWSTLGAGSIVIRELGGSVTAVGNPARIIKLYGR